MATPLDRIVDVAKGVVEKAMLALKIKPPASKGRSSELFPSTDDEAQSIDALLEPKAAPRSPKASQRSAPPPRARVDLREVLDDLLKNKILVATLATTLGFVLILAATRLVVTAPAKRMPAPPRATREGAALVRRMIVPPRSSLTPRMEMEREGAAAYTLEDAVGMGIDWAAIDLTGLSSRNDAATEELYGTVR